MPTLKRSAGFLDTALLVFVVLVVALVAWKIIAGLLGTILLLAKLAVLAAAIAGILRVWVMAKRAAARRDAAKSPMAPGALEGSHPFGELPAAPSTTGRRRRAGSKAERSG